MGLFSDLWSGLLGTKQKSSTNVINQQVINSVVANGNVENAKSIRFCRQDGARLIEYQGNDIGSKASIYLVCPKRHDLFGNYNNHTFEFLEIRDISAQFKYDEQTGKKL